MGFTNVGTISNNGRIPVSVAQCRSCGTRWAATVQPCCPTCLLAAWLASPNLISRKHDPEHESIAHEEYRSVVSADIVADIRSILEAAVSDGTWYYNVEYEKFNHVTRLPLQRKPGKGLSSGNTNPDRHLDDLVIADADQDPHVFADDRDETRRKIAAGIYRPLEPCSRAKCDNLSTPRQRKCVLHSDPPLATLDR
jgi:hypothetical protein